jgi:hypothetical protein
VATGMPDPEREAVPPLAAAWDALAGAKGASFQPSPERPELSIGPQLPLTPTFSVPVPVPVPQIPPPPPAQLAPEPRGADAPAPLPPASHPPVVLSTRAGELTLDAPPPERSPTSSVDSVRAAAGPRVPGARSLRDAVRDAIPPVFRSAEQAPQPPQPPRVTVNIGRVEVRTTPEAGRSAAPRPGPPRRAQPDRAARPLSLGDYLARRTEEGGPR